MFFRCLEQRKQTGRSYGKSVTTYTTFRRLCRKCCSPRRTGILALCLIFTQWFTAGVLWNRYLHFNYCYLGEYLADVSNNMRSMVAFAPCFPNEKTSLVFRTLSFVPLPFHGSKTWEATNSSITCLSWFKL